jgi:hypothetical protein
MSQNFYKLGHVIFYFNNNLILNKYLPMSQKFKKCPDMFVVYFIT